MSKYILSSTLSQPQPHCPPLDAPRLHRPMTSPIAPTMSHGWTTSSAPDARGSAKAGLHNKVQDRRQNRSQGRRRRVELFGRACLRQVRTYVRLHTVGVAEVDFVTEKRMNLNPRIMNPSICVLGLIRGGITLAS
jgi:hypothetical protein